MKFWKRFLFFFDFILPFPLFPLMLYLWYLRTDGNFLFALYVLLLPLLWGYIFPGVGTNLLHLWRFRGGFLIGRYYIHHGIMYAGPLALLLYATYGAGPGSLGQAITIVFTTAGVQGFFSCQHDIQAVRCGTLEIENRPAREGKSAEEIVNYFSPITFFLIGATYAISAILAHHLLVLTPNASVGEFMQAIFYGLLLMTGVPAIPWLALSSISKERL